MSEKLTGYRIFIATPGGLQEQRKAFRKVISDYNECEAIHRVAHFIPVGWEITLGGIGRPQSLINEDIRKCDFFVLMLWDRWGSPPDASGTGRFTSGTEEEYHIALECMRDQNRPMRQIVVFFKSVDPRQLTDPGDQLKKVLTFKQTLESEHSLLFHTFDQTEEFENWLRRYLGQWLRDHEGGGTVKGSPAGPPPEPAVPVSFPLSPPPGKTEEPRITELLDEAKKLAQAGKLTEAETRFAQATVRGDSPAAINAYGLFLYRVGRLAQAEVNFRRVLEIAESMHQEEWAAAVYGNLGLIYKSRGQLAEAEQMHRKALEIDERLGDQEGVAEDYSNLGLVFQSRGKLDEAEQMYRKALEIYERLGNQQGMAEDYGNLGLIFQSRGKLDEAEQMHRKALEIDERLGNQEGMANQYNNLGLIYRTRGQLDIVKEYWTKAKALYDKVGIPDGSNRVEKLLSELAKREAKK